MTVTCIPSVWPSEVKLQVTRGFKVRAIEKFRYEALELPWSDNVTCVESLWREVHESLPVHQDEFSSLEG